MMVCFFWLALFYVRTIKIRGTWSHTMLCTVQWKSKVYRPHEYYMYRYILIHILLDVRTHGGKYLLAHTHTGSSTNTNYQRRWRHKHTIAPNKFWQIYFYFLFTFGIFNFIVFKLIDTFAIN